MKLVATRSQHNRPSPPANVHELVAPAAVRADEVDTKVINIRLDVIERELAVATDALPHGRLPNLEGTVA